MKTAILCLFLTTFSVTLHAQRFQGTIEFKKMKAGKTSTYIYYVQDHMVRLEEYGTQRTIVDIALINLKEHKVFLLSPERKSYMILQTNETTKDMTKTTVNMTRETQKILGRDTKKWVVSNNSPDVKATVTYWVTSGNFDFFVELLAVLKRKDYHSLFFQQVPEAAGYFPMVSVWSDLEGVEKERLEVTKIDERVLRGNFFTIPSDYVEMKN